MRRGARAVACNAVHGADVKPRGGGVRGGREQRAVVACQCHARHGARVPVKLLHRHQWVNVVAGRQRAGGQGAVVLPLQPRQRIRAEGQQREGGAVVAGDRDDGHAGIELHLSDASGAANGTGGGEAADAAAAAAAATGDAAQGAVPAAAARLGEELQGRQARVGATGSAEEGGGGPRTATSARAACPAVAVVTAAADARARCATTRAARRGPRR